MSKPLVYLALTLAIGLSSRFALANVVGADTQNFNPTNDGLDFVTVHSSETLHPGLLNMGFFLNYAVNSLPNYENTTSQTRTNFRDTLLSSDLNFALGVSRGWEVGMSFPYLWAQTVDSDLSTFRGEFASTGLTEFRLMTKIRLLGDQDHGLATILSANFNQIEDNPFLGTDAGPTFNFELAADKSFGKIAVGANVGYRLRDPGAQLPGIPIEPIGNQFIASAAVSYLLRDLDTKIIGEIFGSFPTESGTFVSDRDDSTAEALLGLKHDYSRSIAFHVGGGTEIFQGTSSPDWRLYTGVNWVIGPLFAKPRDVIVRVDDQPLSSLEDMETTDPYAGRPVGNEAFIARDVLFEFNSDKLQPEAEDTLREFTEYLLRPPGIKTVTVEGHTDSVGPAIYNADLSQRRANRVRRALVEYGLKSNQVRAVGYGESRPIADNGNYQGRQMNRRVEFKVIR